MFHTGFDPQVTRTRTGVVLVLALLLALTAEPSRAGSGKKAPKISSQAAASPTSWGGYFQDPKGRRTPIREPLDRNEDKDWLFLRFRDHDGPRLRLAVAAVENRSGAAVEVPLPLIEGLLARSLHGTHRFDLLGQEHIELAARESGEDDLREVARKLGVHYLIYAGIDQWTLQDKTSKLAAAFTQQLGGRVGRQVATVTMTFAIVDPDTGEPRHTSIQEIRFGLTKWQAEPVALSFDFGQWLGKKASLDLEAQIGNLNAKSPLVLALQAVIHKGTYALSRWLEDQPWQGRILRVDGDKVYINAGMQSGLDTGLTLDALSKGEELTDPVLGSLGWATEKIGILRVTDVEDRFSVATVVTGCSDVKEGDLVELVVEP